MLEHAVQLTSQPRWRGPFWGTDDLVRPSPWLASAAGGDPSCYSPCAPAPAWHPLPALPVPGAPPVLDTARVGQRGPAVSLHLQPADATQFLLVSTVSAPWGSARVPSAASSPGLPWERAPPPPARSEKQGCTQPPPASSRKVLGPVPACRGCCVCTPTALSPAPADSCGPVTTRRPPRGASQSRPFTAPHFPSRKPPKCRVLGKTKPASCPALTGRFYPITCAVVAQRPGAGPRERGPLF